MMINNYGSEANYLSPPDNGVTSSTLLRRDFISLRIVMYNHAKYEQYVKHTYIDWDIFPACKSRKNFTISLVSQYFHENRGGIIGIKI